jgi:3-phosphoshikimate 1-carboxyvinyltransferase
MGALFAALRSLGADIQCEKGQDHLPVTIRARGLRGNVAQVRAMQSSQFASALLMIAPLVSMSGADGDFRLELRGATVSEPYLRMTHLLMQKFGVQAKPLPSRRGWRVPRPQGYEARALAIPPDASAASYFFAAVALCGGSVTIAGLSRQFANSLQGDAEFVEYLQKLGCRVSDRGGLRVGGARRPEKFFPRRLNMADVSDVAITLAVLAPLLPRPTIIGGLAHARLQETDRVRAVATELRKIGVTVEARPDGWKIFPTRQFRPATIETYGDHRLAMAFAILGLKDVMGNGKAWLRIKHPACVSKTFPDFFQKLEQLRTT